MTSPKADAGVEPHPIERLWREAGLPEYFLGNGGTNKGLYKLYDSIRSMPVPAPSGLDKQTIEADTPAPLATEAERLHRLADRLACAPIIDGKISISPKDRDALFAILNQPQEDGWRTIDSAPKDGAPLLAIRADWWTPVNGNNRWVYSRITETAFDTVSGQFEMHGLKQPTHWRPLPTPPSAGVGG